MEEKKILPVKSDVVFRLFFADERNIEFLVSFLKATLDLPEDDYDEIEILDPHLLREYPTDKLGIIDIKLKTKSKGIVHIEVQFSVSSTLKNRILYYDAKLITEQLGSGDDYASIRRVISIVVADEDLIENSKNYHHRFTLHDKNAGVEFTDLLEVHTLELSKLPAQRDKTALYDWARFIGAETEEELAMAAQANQQIGRAIVKLRELSADEKARDLYNRREKERRDMRMFMNDARKAGLEEGMAKGMEKGMEKGLAKERQNTVQTMRAQGMSDEDIANLFKYPLDEVRHY